MAFRQIHSRVEKNMFCRCLVSRSSEPKTPSPKNRGEFGGEIRRENLLSLVVYRVIYDGFYTSQVVGNGISEPSTVW